MKVAKWLVLEDGAPASVEGFDRVFSYVSEEGDCFPYQVLSPDEDEALYNEAYSFFVQKLSQRDRVHGFSHAGVDLFRCLKKKVFEYLYYAFVRYAIFRRLFQNHPADEFTLLQKPPNFIIPYLSEILSASPLNGHPRIRFLEGANPSRAFVSRVPRFRDAGWPAQFAWGRRDRSEVVLFSDFEKSKSLLKTLTPPRIVYYACVQSPRLFLKSRRTGCDFYQAALDARRLPAYREKAQGYRQRLLLDDTFAGSIQQDIHIDKLLSPKMEELLAVDLPELLFQIDAMHRFFRGYRHLRSALLDEDVSPVKNAFCQVARQYGIRTFVECHGSLGHRSGYLPLTADRIFVWGAAQKRKLESWGCPPSRIFVTGCSRYSFYVAKDAAPLKKRVARDLALDPRKKIVLIAFTPVKPPRKIFIQDMKRRVMEMLEIVLQKSDVQFIIKCHPGESAENKRMIQTWREKNHLKNRVSVVEKYDPLILAMAADVLVIYRSTYAIDGFALKKPVICYRDSECSMLEEFRPYQVFRYAENPEELSRALDDLLSHPENGAWGQPKARQELLNENGVPPEEIIASYLKEPRLPAASASWEIEARV